jgi:hypothetical protein
LTVLEPICRGLVAYVSYLAACRNSTVYSEYLLYEPLVRIGHAQGYTVRCEVPVARSASGKGDWKRIDFELTKSGRPFGIEMKWITSPKPDITNDVDKLLTYNRASSAPGFVLFFGPSKHFETLRPKAGCSALGAGKLVAWHAGRTSYSARWFRYA